MTTDTPTLPLSGITVIDLSRVLAGPYSTMLLADLGARVIKIENPDGGDDSRHVGPFVDGESAYFASINRNKESIALNLKDSNDRAIFEAMLIRADVLVENFRAGVMDKLGYSWDWLKERYPQLIYASISGFGQTGPYSNRPAYDMVVQAMGGIMSVTGEQGGLPARIGVSIGDLGAGLYATIGIQSALIRRGNTGAGQRVDVSMLDCQLALLENPVARYSATGQVPQPLGTRHSSITPFDMFKTQDGHIVIAVGNDSLFVKFAAAMAHPEWAADERFVTVRMRNDNHIELKRLIEQCLAVKTTAEWSHTLEQAGVPHGPINRVSDLVNDAHVQSREMLTTVAIGEGKTLQVVGNPIKLNGQMGLENLRSAPKLNEHGAALMAEFRTAATA